VLAVLVAEGAVEGRGGGVGAAAAPALVGDGGEVAVESGRGGREPGRGAGPVRAVEEQLVGAVERQRVRGQPELVGEQLGAAQRGVQVGQRQQTHRVAPGARAAQVPVAVPDGEARHPRLHAPLARRVVCEPTCAHSAYQTHETGFSYICVFPVLQFCYYRIIIK